MNDDQAELVRLTAARIRLEFLALAGRAGLLDGREREAVKVAQELRLFALVELGDQGNLFGLRLAVQALQAVAPSLFGPPVVPVSTAALLELGLPLVHVATRYPLRRA